MDCQIYILSSANSATSGTSRKAKQRADWPILERQRRHEPGRPHSPHLRANINGSAGVVRARAPAGVTSPGSIPGASAADRASDILHPRFLKLRRFARFCGSRASAELSTAAPSRWRLLRSYLRHRTGAIVLMCCTNATDSGCFARYTCYFGAAYEAKRPAKARPMGRGL